MLMKLDKFLVKAFREEGYEGLNFKRLQQIYKKSRAYPEQKARAKLNSVGYVLLSNGHLAFRNGNTDTDLTE
jgi:hypothetical protein